MCLWRDAPFNFGAGLGQALDDKIAHDQIIHLGVHKTAVGVFRRADNRLPAHIKRSVDEK
jgi:hypothetical protein